ncbi:carboxypeptidase-like regulatory domain-containing protein [Aquimarina sp. MMG016]|uniref:TonB-dependent receptor n=1 Tax=Aquimarina sp. MMG016 TaxID=2822690 RepID=UPI001B3A2DC9|nr:carboxypeptidase-like regulatory domain-containing protein [Aquimarina sp. MMG016]MBQ4821041.1 TonB-dependent receptor plug domain-containing protein [Aquimarina sp. MMG016]
MRKILIISFLFNISLMVSQDDKSKISITFDDFNIQEAINSIEKITDYHFYYNQNWFTDKIISKSYQNVDLEIILDDIFKDTVINYYLLNENEVVLIQNNIIYDNLPKGFFGKKNETNTEKLKNKGTEVKPIFYRNNKPSKKSEIIRIGKESKGNPEKNVVLSGYAINIRTGEPIANLAIKIKENDITIQSDQNGYYQVELPIGKYTIETRSLGIEDSRKIVVLYNSGELNFNLNESLELLDEVILEAEIDKNVTETITGTEQIDVEESKNIPLVLGERDVLKVATTLPGITTAGEGSAGFNVRGGKSDQNLILLDDGVVYNPQHFFGIFSALNPFALGEVNIYKGTIPAEYGGRLSSVFDLKTKEGNVSKFGGEASIGPVTGNLVLETPIVKEKSSLLVGGRGAYANWILRSLDDESLNNSEASFYDVIGNYSHKINENNNIKTTAYLSRDDFSITSDSLYIYSNRLLSLKWDHRFDDKNNGSLLLANSQYKFNIEFDGDSSNDFDLGYSIEETEVKLKMNYLYSQKYKFSYGINSKLYTVRPGSIEPLESGSIIKPLRIPKERGLESAAFISGKLDLTEKFSINAGLRYSIYNALGERTQRIFENGRPRNETTVIDTLSFGKNEVIKKYGGPEVRVSARYLLGDDFSIKGSYNNTFQYIHRLSNNTTVSPVDIWKLSDLNIEPQRANQYSLGLYKNLKNNSYEISLEGFYKRSKNILDFKTGAQILLNESIETEVLQGEGKAYGIEFLLRKNKGKFNGWLGYTYSRSLIKLDSDFPEERVNNGDFFPSNFDKPHDISLVTNYKLTNRFSLSTNFVYQTGRPVTFPVGRFNFNGSDFVVFSDRNKFRIPDFYRLDIGFNIEGNHKIKKFAHSFWTISIYNVLGRNNPFSVFFVTDNGEIKALKSSIFSVPIPSITYNFRF